MSNSQTTLATPTDNAELCRILRESHMPGQIQIAYTREPSFFDAIEVHGRHNDVILVKADQRIIGFGLRSVKTVYVNRKPTPVGYLSNLRTSQLYRRPTDFVKGYRFLRKLHDDQRTPFYLSTILGENDHARKVLTSRRMGLPNYDDYGLFYCAAISLNRFERRKRPHELNIRRAQESDLPVLVKFLNEEGRNKQFFPAYTSDDFRMPGGLLRNLKLENIFLAFSGNNDLIGTTAVWNQNPFRQAIVNGYGPLFRFLRPPYNVLAHFTGYPVLPRSGSKLDTATLALCCVRHNDPNVFAYLLSEAIGKHRHEFKLLAVGFHERDPLLNVIKTYHHIPYKSRLYTVYWEDGKKAVDRLGDELIPYLELGAL